MIKGKAMTQGSPWKHILIFALPVLAGSLLQQLYNTVDTIIVGNFAGEDSLSAVGTTAPVTFLFLAIAMGFSQGNGVLVSQYYGANDESKVRRAASTGLVFIFSLGIAATVLGLLLAKPIIVRLIHVPDEIVDLTVEYFSIYILGLIFQFGYNIFSSILRSVGDSAATLYFLLISSVLNIILDLLFVTKFHWGVAGAAIATDIAQAVSFVCAYLYMSKKYPVFKFKIKEMSCEKEYIKKTITIGFPMALQLMIVSMGLTLIQRAVNEFGKTMTASFTVGQRIEMYLNLPCNAFQTTLATYTGQNIGADKMKRVSKGARQAVAMSLAFSVVIAICMWTFSPNIIKLFGISAESAVFCNSHIRAISLVNLILALYVPLFGVFQGSGHGGIPTVVACCALTTRVIVTYLFRYSAFFGHSIIWWNGLFGFAVGCTISWCYYLSRRWQKNAKV